MRTADNLPPKSGSLNFLEPSGPVQACNGTAVRSRMVNRYDPIGGGRVVRAIDWTEEGQY